MSDNESYPAAFYPRSKDQLLIEAIEASQQFKAERDEARKRVQELEESLAAHKTSVIEVGKVRDRLESELARLKASTVPVHLIGHLDICLWHYDILAGEARIKRISAPTEAEARQKAADWIAAQHKVSDLQAVQAQLNAQPVPDGLEVWPLDKDDK